MPLRRHPGRESMKDESGRRYQGLPDLCANTAHRKSLNVARNFGVTLSHCGQLRSVGARWHIGENRAKIRFFRTFGEKRQETTNNGHTPTRARSGKKTSSRNSCGISVSLLQFVADGEYHQMCGRTQNPLPIHPITHPSEEPWETQRRKTPPRQ